ncbi:MAG: 16S rRNA (uracil(1498)-N(3))-methyltransferase [Clostridia bacterium]|nr:16S rRNA (uracil(1498)-N(3))-methyltransferase [Clostridia bacterium]
MPKFFVDPSQIFDDQIAIIGDDAKHLALSLRMRKGDQIQISDGHKTDYDCIITSIDPLMVKCDILTSGPCESEPILKIRVFQCLPKGDKMEYIIQKAVELGAAEIIPVNSSRCIAKPPIRSKNGVDKKLERWNRIAYEAAEQSRRGIIPKVLDYIDYDDAIRMCSNDFMRFICYEDESHMNLRDYISSKQNASTTNLVVSFFIGPEGGFSTDEIERAKIANIPAVSLGKRILRTETASSFVLSVISYLTEFTDK